MRISSVSVSLVSTAGLRSLHSNAVRHRAGQYRSDHLCSGVWICFCVPKKALAHSNLDCDGAEALSSVFAWGLANQEAIYSVFHSADFRARDFRLYVGSIAPYWPLDGIRPCRILRLSY